MLTIYFHDRYVIAFTWMFMSVPCAQLLSWVKEQASGHPELQLHTSGGFLVGIRNTTQTSARASTLKSWVFSSILNIRIFPFFSFFLLDREDHKGRGGSGKTGKILGCIMWTLNIDNKNFQRRKQGIHGIKRKK